jgi:hypothetical protein
LKNSLLTINHFFKPFVKQTVQYVKFVLHLKKKIYHMIPFAFLHNRFKWLGLCLFIGGFTLNYLLSPNLSLLSDGVGLSVQVLILTGLLIIICSKQKEEDEYINHVRLISLQWAVILLILLRLSWKTMGYLTDDESWMPHWQVNSLLEFYLLFFYYTTWFKERVINLFKTTK